MQLIGPTLKVANVDVTLRITNPALYKQLTDLVNKPHTVNLDLKFAGTNVQNLKQQITQRLGQVDVNVNPILGNVQTLRQQIQNAIGSISINVSIGNLAALNTQIRQLFAGMGIQTGGLNNPPTPRPPLAQQAPGVRYQARLQRNSTAIQRRQQKYQAEFEESELLNIALLGPQRAAQEFELTKGLQPGTVNPNGVRRLSFDPMRAFSTRGSRDELGFAALYGGLPGLVGGLIGGGAFGEGGVFLGSAIFQKAVGLIGDSFSKITETLTGASQAGLKFQQSVNTVSLSLQTTSKVVDNAGKEADLGTSLKFQGSRARDLVGKATNLLSPFGVGGESIATGIRAVAAGGSRSGISFNDDQILKIIRPLVGFTALTNEDLMANNGRFANVSEDFLAGQFNNELGRSLLGSKVGPEIKKAIASNDAEAFVKAFEKLDKIMVGLVDNSDSAAIALRKVDTEISNLQREFGEQFIQALVPGIKEFAKQLSTPGFKESLATLGKGIGELVNFIVMAAAKVSNLISENPKLGAAAAGGAAAGSLAGAVGGAGVGFALGGIPGAVIGGLVGPVVGGVLGGAGGLAGGGLRQALENQDKQSIINTVKGANKTNQQLKAVANPSITEVLNAVDIKNKQSLAQGTLEAKFISDATGVRRQAEELGLIGDDRRAFVAKGLTSARTDANIGNFTAINNVQQGREQFSTFMADSIMALEDFNLKIEESTRLLGQLNDKQQLNLLQGEDRQAALAKQIRDAGGIVSSSGISGFSTMEDPFTRGELNFGPLRRSADEERALKIAKLQFDINEKDLNPFTLANQNRQEEIAARRSRLGLQTNAALLPLQMQAKQVEFDKQMVDNLNKLTPEELDDILDPSSGKSIGKDLLKESQDRLSKMGTGNLDVLQKAFGNLDSPIKQLQSTVEKELQSIGADIKTMVNVFAGF